MRTVLAALDASAAARPVVETALGIGRLMDARVHAVHVGDESVETLEALTSESHIPLRTLRGQVEQTVLDAAAASGVVAAVLGARATPGGRRPIGGTALGVVEGANRPVVVVPPEAVGVSPRPFRRLLIPLEGNEESSRPVVEQLYPLIVDRVELLVLHVFTTATVPRVLDRPHRDMELLGREFLARHCPCATRVEWRTGPIGARVTEVCGEEAADLVVLSWSQDSTTGHAAVVRDVLASSTVPVLLLPAT